MAGTGLLDSHCGHPPGAQGIPHRHPALSRFGIFSFFSLTVAQEALPACGFCSHSQSSQGELPMFSQSENIPHLEPAVSPSLISHTCSHLPARPNLLELRLKSVYNEGSERWVWWCTLLTPARVR